MRPRVAREEVRSQLAVPSVRINKRRLREFRSTSSSRRRMAQTKSQRCAANDPDARAVRCVVHPHVPACLSRCGVAVRYLLYNDNTLPVVAPAGVRRNPKFHLHSLTSAGDTRHAQIALVTETHPHLRTLITGQN